MVMNLATSNCTCRFSNLKQLIAHLGQGHNAHVKIETVDFPNIHSFLTWKEDVELKSYSHYVQQCSSTTSGDDTKWYYYCNRAGKYKPKGTGVRQSKMQGTSKIGQQCTAHMKVLQKKSGEVSVEYCVFHTHDVRLGHLPLPESARKYVAAKLEKGVDISKILNNIRNEVCKSFGRKDLLDRQDILNIKRQLMYKEWRDTKMIS